LAQAVEVNTKTSNPTPTKTLKFFGRIFYLLSCLFIHSIILNPIIA
jgi:hypothetical protein